jgi:hypothetical protein
MANPKLEPENAPGSDEPSQDSTSPVPPAEKTAKGLEDLGSAEPLDETPSQYYHGRRLTMVMVSLLLSTFLVALDNVSGRAFTKMLLS